MKLNLSRGCSRLMRCSSVLGQQHMNGVLLQVLEGLVEEEALGSYVLVEKEDVLDAIGTFVAAYLATVPEAQHMKPAELQRALTSTFRVCKS